MKVEETPLQVAARREKQLVWTYLLKLERGETDAHSDGTCVEISFDGESWVHSFGMIQIRIGSS